MKKHLEYVDAKSSKFWTIEVESNAHTVIYGKIGTDGQSKTKTFEDTAQAIKDAEKLVKAKMKKGYKAAEENEEKWFEKLKTRVHDLYKAAILEYTPKPYRYIQLHWTGQGYALGLSTNVNENYWEYLNDNVEDDTEWTLENVYRELEDIPYEEYDKDDDCEYEVEFKREEWPFNSVDCFELECFLINAILGISFLKLEKEKALEGHLSKIEVIKVVSADRNLAPFSYHLPEAKVRQKIVDALIDKEEDKKRVLDLWKDQLKEEGEKFLNSFEREISENVEPAENTFQETYSLALDPFIKMQRFSDAPEQAQEVIDLLENKLEENLHNKDERPDLREECCDMVGSAHRELGDYQKATDWYLKGITLKMDGSCLINLMELYATNTNNFEALVKLGEQYSKDSGKEEFDHLLRKYRYLGIAYINSGDEEKAEQVYKRLLKIVEHENIAEKEKVRKELQALANSNVSTGDIVTEILSWFKGANLENDEISNNQNWWKTIPDEVRSSLLQIHGMFNVDPDEVSDTVILKMIQTESLFINNKGLTDISFVEKMKWLEMINIEDNEITDLSPLKNLTGLKILQISNNPIENLAPLSKLIHLKEFEVSECLIQNFAGIENMVKLIKLVAKQNKLTDIQTLPNLSSLRKLDLYGNDIKDISALGKCLKLESINLEENEVETGIEDIIQLPLLSDFRLDKGIGAKELKNAPHLTGKWKPYYKKHQKELDDALANWVHLVNTTPFWKKQFWWDKKPDPSHAAQVLLSQASVFVENKKIEDLEPLRPLKKVAHLYLEGVKATDLSPIENWELISSLTISKSKINSLKPLKNITSLDNIYAVSSGLTNLEGIENCVEMTLLQLSENKIESLEPLKKMTKMDELILESNELKSLEGISNMTDLTKLNISSNPPLDVSPLAGCKELRTILCSNTTIKSGLMDLVSLPNLKKINSNQSLSESEIEEFRKARPDVYIN